MKKLLSLILAAIISIGSITLVAAETTKTIGDVDNDNKISVKDATIIQKFIAGIIDFDAETFIYADTDGSGKISVADATYIQKYIAGIINDFPANKQEIPTTEPTTDATDPISTSTEATTEPAEPTTEPVEPTTQPTTEKPEPTTKPTEPATEPTTVMTEPTTTPIKLHELEVEIFNLVNEERAKYNIKPLEFGYFYYDAAKVRAEELAVNFSHDRPNGEPCWMVFDDFGIGRNRYIGENIASGFYDAESVMEAWMNSEGHASNILFEDFDYLAVAVREMDDRPGDYYMEQLFLSCPYDKYDNKIPEDF